MKIAHFNNIDYVGGAAKVAYRLHSYLNENIDGAESLYFVRNKTLLDNSILVPEKYSDRTVEIAVINKYIKSSRTKLTNSLFSFTYVGEDSIFDLPVCECDVFHLHWIENFLSIKNIRDLISLNKPVIYTLHDEKPYTGGCHCTFGCLGFTEVCSNCVQLQPDKHKLPLAVLADKINFFSSSCVHVVAPSNWIKEQARKSSVFRNADIKVIPHGIDTSIYNNASRDGAKENIGISKDVITIMFNAHNCEADHKGFKYFLSTIDKCLADSNFSDLCKKEKVQLILVGGNIPEIDLQIPTIIFGYINTDSEIALLYQATDILINPSLADSFSLVSLESMACGAVVAGFKTGGMLDFITASNGVLVEQRDDDALADAILSLVSNDEARGLMSMECVRVAREKYSLKNQAEAYSEYYYEIIKSYTRPAAQAILSMHVENKITRSIRYHILYYQRIYRICVRVISVLPKNKKDVIKRIAKKYLLLNKM